MLAIEYRSINGEERACPVFRCDACGGIIEGEQKGNYVWFFTDALETIPDLFTVHKGACDQRFEAEHGKHHALWGDLDALPGRLEVNLGLEAGESRQIAFREIGV